MFVYRLIPVLVAASIFSGIVETAIGQTHQSLREASQGFLQRYCLDCHGVDSQEGGVRFDFINETIEEGKDAAVWDRVLTQVQIRDMPPSDALQPDHQTRMQFVELIETMLEESGNDQELQKRRSLPQY
ncbi:hypothetical protein N9D38_06030, partial [Rubripirellula sp.]|nr:hypothetical protein [Rubripirellula sp.]